jgi:hypothetical protein
MEKERKNNKIVIMALLVAVMSLTVAFAATLSNTLNINGTASIADAQWNVYFASATKTAGSTLNATSGPTISGDTITYAVNLEENKYFEFDAVVKNDGTYDAKLSNLTIAGAENYTDLVTYTTSGLEQGDVIAAGQSATITVKVAMGTVTNDNISKLNGNQSLTLTLVADFVQAD